MTKKNIRYSRKKIGIERIKSNPEFCKGKRKSLKE